MHLRLQAALRLLLLPALVAAVVWLAVSHPAQTADMAQAAVKVVAQHPVAAGAAMAVAAAWALGPAVMLTAAVAAAAAAVLVVVLGTAE